MTKLQINEYEFVEIGGSEFLKNAVFDLLIGLEREKLNRQMPEAFRFVRLNIEERIKQRLFRLRAVKGRYKPSESEQPYVYYTFRIGSLQVTVTVSAPTESGVLSLLKKLLHDIRALRLAELREQEKMYVRAQMLQKAIEKRMEALS